MDYGVGIGEVGEPKLALRIRSHANFAEMVGAPGWTVHLLLIGLLTAWIVHPLGMIMPAGSSRRRCCVSGHSWYMGCDPRLC